MTESPFVDSSLAVLVFSPRDDPIACLNKEMDFLIAIASSRTLARQCTQPKRLRNAAWYKDKAMLAKAQEAEQILDEEQLIFLADPGVSDGQAVQTIISNNAAFQTEDLDTYNSDCDDILNAKAVLMTNISNYGSEVILEAQQDSMILSVIEQMSEQMINHVFKDQFYSIKKTCIHTKEQSGSLVDKLNLKSAENKDLKAQIHDKVFVITSLKNELEKLKGKEIVDIAAQTPSAYTIVSGMFKLDLELLASRLLQNKKAHIEYLMYTQEQADILWGIVEQAKAKKPLDKELDFACKHAQRIQELLVYVRDTCPNAIKLNEKKVVVTPKNKVKKVRFVEPLTSSNNFKQVESSTTSDSNTLVLSPTRLKCSTSNCGSKPTDNKKNDRM
nr:hypothetical protein [Tanacetum cinerariifolium]